MNENQLLSIAEEDNVKSSHLRAIEVSLESLAELRAERELVYHAMVDKIVEYACSLVEDDDWQAEIKDKIMTLHRATITRKQELDEMLDTEHRITQALVVGWGASVSFAGLSASYRKPSRYLDQDAVKSELRALGANPDNDRFYKERRASCSIKPSRRS